MATLLEELGVSDIRDAPNPVGGSGDGGGDGGATIATAGAAFNPVLHYVTGGDQDPGNYASRSASWNQIDDMVQINIAIEMQNSSGTEDGIATITGIPSDCPAPLRDTPCSFAFEGAGTAAAYFALIVAGTRTIRLYHMVNGSRADMSFNDIDAFAKLSVSASYSILS